MFKQTKPIIYIKCKKRITRKTSEIILLKHIKNQLIDRVDLDVKKIADKLLISDRVDQLQKHDGYITVKDHKESFPHNPSFRLINPSKSDIGKVRKTILDQMNKESTSSIIVYIGVSNPPQKHHPLFFTKPL